MIGRKELKKRDYKSLSLLMEALDASPSQLRIDDCDDWRIMGKRGFIIVWGDDKTWVMNIRCRSVRHWTATKRMLSFCEVTQDGDDEGCLRLHTLPTPDQAAVIRDRLGITQYRRPTPEMLERLSALGSKFTRGPKARSGAHTPVSGSEALGYPTAAKLAVGDAQ